MNKKFAKISVYLWICFVIFIQIFFFQPKTDQNMSLGLLLLLTLFGVAVTLPVHELIHFAFMKMFTREPVKIEFARDPSGFPSLRTVSSAAFKKWQKIIINLAPLFFLTLCLDIGFLFFERINFILYIVALGNAAGCFYDVVGIFKKQ